MEYSSHQSEVNTGMPASQSDMSAHNSILMSIFSQDLDVIDLISNIVLWLLMWKKSYMDSENIVLSPDSHVYLYM